MEEDGSRDQAGAQSEMTRINAQQAANDAARRKLEQQLSAALEQANRLQTAHSCAIQEAHAQVWHRSSIFLKCPSEPPSMDAFCGTLSLSGQDPVLLRNRPLVA